MKYLEFLDTFQDFPVFSIYDIEKAFPGFDRKALNVWQKKGYIQKIRNKWYCFANKNFKEEDRFLIANKIYSPSYVSLESALSFYGFIPEGVFLITSVSTLKTTHFGTPVGNFQYRNIQPSLFFGYRLERQQQGPLSAWFKIATPEKAIIDYFYLHSHNREEADIESLRINWDEIAERVDLGKLKNMLVYIKSGALTQRINTFLNLFYARS